MFISLLLWSRPSFTLRKLGNFALFKLPALLWGLIYLCEKLYKVVTELCLYIYVSLLLSIAFFNLLSYILLYYIVPYLIFKSAIILKPVFKQSGCFFFCTSIWSKFFLLTLILLFFLLAWTALSSHKSKFYLSLPIRNCIFCLHIFIKIYCQLYRLGAAKGCDTRFSQSGLTKVLGLQVFYDSNGNLFFPCFCSQIYCVHSSHIGLV